MSIEFCVVFCFRQKAFLDQHNDQEDDEVEHGYDDATLIEVSPILTLDRKEKFVTIETTIAIQECAFCRTKVFNDSTWHLCKSIIIIDIFFMVQNLNII